MMSYIWGIFLLLIYSKPALMSSEFVQTEDSHFQLNGSSFLFNGFNSYWMMTVAVDVNQRYKISNVFRDASAAGLTVCRTWAFSDGGFHALQISPGVYDETVFQALDFVISEASKYGIRLILNLVNNYEDYGGRPQYVQWAKNAGVSIQTLDDFYTNQVVKTHYKNNAQKVLTRKNTISGITYMDDPTIMAWELINEPRCQVDYSGNTLNGWVEEMASFVKSIDKNHLVGIGMEGFYGNSIPSRKEFNPHGYLFGTDFISNNLIAQIDFATIHAYPEVWLSGESEATQIAFLQNWTTIHWTDSKTILKKPLIFAEFGKSSKEPGYTITARDSFLNTVYTSIYNLAKDGGVMAGGLVWQLMAEEMESYYDGYEIILSQSPTKTIMTQQSSRMIQLEH